MPTPPDMYAAVLRDVGALNLERVATPSICTGKDVVVRVRAAVFGAALVRAVTVGHPRLAPPLVLGSLICGDVLAVGEQVIGVERGARIIVDPHPPCGSCCNCSIGEPALCTASFRLDPGGLAEFVRVPDELVSGIRTVPDGVRSEHAVYTEIVACVLAAMDAGGVSIGATVGIIGCGPIAHLMIQVARMRGAAEIYCMHNNFNREASIIKAGATPVAAYDGDSMQRGNALFGEQGVDVAFEAVGKASTYSQSLKIVRPGGTVIAFGGCPPSSTIELDLNFIHYNAIRLIGSYHYPPGSFDAALALIAERSIDLDMIATETLPLSQIAQAPKIAKHPDCLSLTIVP